jgi:hypothetical protein
MTGIAMMVIIYMIAAVKLGLDIDCLYNSLI